jgi:hypothetical protein
MHDREDLAAPPDQSEPLGPWCDESGGRCVHRSETVSLAVVLAGLPGSGASGSVFAIRTGFVMGLAAARPGLSTDFFGADFAAATGLSVDFVGAGSNAGETANGAGASRDPVFKLA